MSRTWGSLRWRVLAPPVVAVVSVAFAPSAGAAKPAPPPPTLDGLVVSGEPTFSTASCSADGSGTFDYSVSGTASGPYAGTYTETGTVTVGQGSPKEFTDGEGSSIITFTLEWSGEGVASGQATFTIDSPVGQVSGSKTWSALTGSCTSSGRLAGTQAGIRFDATLPLQLREANSNGSGLVSYQATIANDGKRTYCDSGTSELDVGVFAADTASVLGFDLTITAPSYTTSFSSGADDVNRGHPKTGCDKPERRGGPQSP